MRQQSWAQGLVLSLVMWLGSCAAEPISTGFGAIGAGQGGSSGAAALPSGSGGAGATAGSGGAAVPGASGSGGTLGGGAGSGAAGGTQAPAAGSTAAGAGAEAVAGTGGSAGIGAAGSSGSSAGGSSGAGAGGGAGGRGGAGAGAGTGGSAGRPPDDGNNSYPPITDGCNGYSTRYWDCCKPHCGWTANVSGGVSPLRTCNASDGSLGGDYNAQSGCNGGSAFMCHGMAPFAAGNRLAYGYAAVSGRGDICGRCFQLQFTGSSHNGGNDPGSAAIAGKTMIVQATNIGGDVGGGQFDILIPGGGVGAMNACTRQLGLSSGELGAQYGGLLTRCKEQVGGADHQALKSCMSQRCTSVFESRGLSELAAGCRWFVEWFEAADNPALVYKEIPCPQELTSGGMNRNSSNVNAGCGI